MLTSANRPNRRRPSAVNTVLILIILLLICVGILELIPANEYMILPGEARAVAPMLSVQGYPRRHFRGELLMTDVSLYKVNHLLEELYARVNSDAELQPAQSFSGGLSDKQYFQLNAQLMDQSVPAAEAAALSLVKGYRANYALPGPEIVFIAPRAPSAKVLKSHDYIVSVNGSRIRHAAQVSPIISRLHPGDGTRLQISRHGHLISVLVKIVRERDVTPGSRGNGPRIGISMQDHLTFPLKIKINAGNIGGPSAGLMFALGIVQRLQTRDLTHGCKVAGTGTIDYNGRVGPIGGSRQKVVAARQAGARYFLVPSAPDNVGPARKAAGSGLKVIPVKSLRQALGVLKALPPCR